MRNSILIVLLASLLVPTSAKSVDEATARTVATHFFATTFNRSLESLTPAIAYSAPVFRGENSTTPAFYVVNFNHDGFVIVAGDDRVQPILAFSDEGAFAVDNMPDNVRFFLEGYNQEIQYMVENQSETDAATRLQWETLLSETTPAPKDGTVVVGPLLGDNKWNQTKYYNDLCPADNSNHAIIIGIRGPELPNAIGEIDSQRISVYPNPSNGVVYLSSHSQTIQQLQVFDMFGKLLLQQNVNDNDSSVNLSTYKSGTYILRLVTSMGIETRKVIKY